MIDKHEKKYDNMHRNGIFYALICINNHVLSCLISMLSGSQSKQVKHQHSQVSPWQWSITKVLEDTVGWKHTFSVNGVIDYKWGIGLHWLQEKVNLMVMW